VVIRYVGSPVQPAKCLRRTGTVSANCNRPFVRNNPSLLNHIKKTVEATAGHVGPAEFLQTGQP